MILSLSRSVPSSVFVVFAALGVLTIPPGISGCAMPKTAVSAPSKGDAEVTASHPVVENGDVDVGDPGGETPVAPAPTDATSSSGSPVASANSGALTPAALLRMSAPDRFRVKFETTEGDVVLEVHKNWAPHGANRFFQLVSIGFYDDAAFFRVLEKFVAQFGLSGDPAVSAVWSRESVPDDPVIESNRRGTIAFAMKGEDSRTTQVFINLRDNKFLDAKGYAPFGRVIEGMDVVDRLFGKYGDGAPRGSGPSQVIIEERGNDYLRSRFPELDYVQKATVVE